MVFNSISYAIFLPIVFVLYWVIPGRVRWILLLLASYYFYMNWNVKYVVLIAGTTLVSFFCAILVEKADKVYVKRLVIAVSIIVSIGILFVFKYYNFTAELLENFVDINIKRLNFLLPVGISFYTFQTISYIVDVYRGKEKAERHLGIYATFVAFFPQLVAGPIERSSDLLPQIKKPKAFNYENAIYGVRLIVWGLYKKMVVADNLAIIVDGVYGNVLENKGFAFVIATVLFTIQIYCDFSGYSDIARGSAKLLNIELMENFKSPYFSCSVGEHWNRWHISLSTWFRDYVYIPLGGSRVSKIRNMFNYLITFLLSGLWHGANLTYVLWGLMHGIALVFEKLFIRRNNPKNIAVKILRIILVFAFINFGFIMFRSSSVSEALYVFSHMFDGIGDLNSYILMGFRDTGISYSLLLTIVVLYIMPIFVYDLISLKVNILEWIGKRKMPIRYAFIIMFIGLIIVFGYVGKSTFVYFQF